MRHAIRILAPLAALLLAAGCGPTNTASNAPGPPPTSGPAPGGAATSGPAPGGAATSVVVISPALTSVFHQELVKGAEEAAKQRGWDFSHLEPDKETNSADQVMK